jgi:hypothetical protein
VKNVCVWCASSGNEYIIYYVLCILRTGSNQSFPAFCLDFWGLGHCATSRRVSGSIPSGVAGGFFPKLPT